jgi:hypothetical protein
MAYREYPLREIDGGFAAHVVGMERHDADGAIARVDPVDRGGAPSGATS